MPLYEYHCTKCGLKTEVLYIRSRKVYCVCGQEMERCFPCPAFIDADQFRSKEINGRES